ncbi:CAAD domain-containing protein [Allocoleopsis sp.]|uniref:CAAD domain-containing protein n=1 Tax=Allocoleopsis sp. TaxID=3088169 RepID=UPI002FCFB5EB
MTTEIVKSEEMIEVQEEAPIVEVKVEDNLKLSKMPSPKPAKEEQWLQFGEKTSEFITDLQNSVGEFFQKYQPLLASLGWIFFALISVKVMLALLDAINDIPLLSVLLELIGLGYGIWFIYRYLLTAATRQELSGEIQNFKKQVFDVES